MTAGRCFPWLLQSRSRNTICEDVCTDCMILSFAASIRLEVELTADRGLGSCSPSHAHLFLLTLAAGRSEAPRAGEEPERRGAGESCVESRADPPARPPPEPPRPLFAAEKTPAGTRRPTGLPHVRRKKSMARFARPPRAPQLPQPLTPPP